MTVDAITEWTASALALDALAVTQSDPEHPEP